MYVIFSHRTTACTIAMAVVLNVGKTWMRKKECCIAVINISMYVIVITALSMQLLMLMSLQYFPRMKMKMMMTGPLFLKKVEAPAPLFQPQAVYGR